MIRLMEKRVSASGNNSSRSSIVSVAGTTGQVVILFFSFFFFCEIRTCPRLWDHNKRSIILVKTFWRASMVVGLKVRRSILRIYDKKKTIISKIFRLIVYTYPQHCRVNLHQPDSIASFLRSRSLLDDRAVVEYIQEINMTSVKHCLVFPSFNNAALCVIDMYKKVHTEIIILRTSLLKHLYCIRGAHRLLFLGETLWCAPYHATRCKRGCRRSASEILTSEGNHRQFTARPDPDEPIKSDKPYKSLRISWFFFSAPNCFFGPRTFFSFPRMGKSFPSYFHLIYNFSCDLEKTPLLYELDKWINDAFEGQNSKDPPTTTHQSEEPSTNTTGHLSASVSPATADVQDDATTTQDDEIKVSLECPKTPQSKEFKGATWQESPCHTAVTSPPNLHIYIPILSLDNPPPLPRTVSPWGLHKGNHSPISSPESENFPGAMDALNACLNKMMRMLAEERAQQLATEEHLCKTQPQCRTPAPPPTSSPNSMVLAKPQPFNGTHGAAAEPFVGQILLHTYPKQFPTNSSKVDFAVIMTDCTATWSQSYMMKVLNAEEVAFNKFLDDFNSPSPAEPLLPLWPSQKCLSWLLQSEKEPKSIGSALTHQPCPNP
ncbi:uncharacterized protein VP01_937g1 [Puccinia sorghi]|uniref:Uncharacterized protein n=1 Tax=Puccinia sorghi TaxID=27349 RepID=A0A0L6U6V5_9BASI|nr:uncharacterized protein VP01_937g1 [Puccinia sorghi]